jgi:hypothetical protein
VAALFETLPSRAAIVKRMLTTGHPTPTSLV